MSDLVNVDFIANSTNSKKIRDAIHSLSKTFVPILIEGEIGTGKDFLIHQFLKSNNQLKLIHKIPSEFINVENSDSLIFNLQLSKDTIYHFESINLFPKLIQSKLYKFINKNKSNYKFIFSSVYDLLKMDSEKKINDELYHEISGIFCKLPNLSERSEDIPFFIHHFLTIFKEIYSKKNISFKNDLVQFLSEQYYTGNITQLKNIIESIVIFSKDTSLDRKSISVDFKKKNFYNQDSLKIIPNIPLKIYEKAILEKNLIHNNGNRLETAKILGITERTIYRKIKDYKLNL